MTDEHFDLDHLDHPEPGAAPSPSRALAPERAYLDGLNPAQREAVEATEGPVLVLAGAGTGKTRVLTTRLTHILAEGKATPGQLLAVTFTNKAARQMQDQVAALIGRPVEGMAIGTFHSIAAKILRQHAEVVGLKSNYTILDTDDQLRLLKQLIRAENIDEKRWPARMLATFIDRWKNKALKPDRVPPGETHLYADGQGVNIYAQYQNRLRVLNAADFGDLLLHNLTILQEHGDILRQFHARFRYLLVDEYQDTNLTQYLWLRLLAQGSKNICCVGDDDQSIYGWRGAEVGNILKFSEDFPGAQIIRLEQNYRSTQHILGAASGLIEANTGRLGKTLWTEREGGDRVKIQGVWDGPEEARVIGEEIEAAQTNGYSLNEMAVMVRAGFQTREFEERFITLGLPYRVIGGPRFYERSEIRDAMAYFRVIAQPADDLAFERIVNVPKRGLGSVSINSIHQVARDKGIPMSEAARLLVDTEELKPRARNSLSGFLADLHRWGEAAQHIPHTELAKVVLEESGYMAIWQADKSPDAPGRLENLTELVRAMEEFENLEGFLEHIALVLDNEKNRSEARVSIMTLHAAKGLEFDLTFLPGWEENLFPHKMALDESGNDGLEEERRLAYVGLTRAKVRAHILFAANRQVYGQWQSAMPSRFIDELPGKHTEHIASQGLYGATQSRRFTHFEAEENTGFGGHGSGWDRAQSQRQQRRQSISVPRRRKAPKLRAVSDFAIGERVFHDKFGYGMVSDVDGDKLVVEFEMSGSKKIMDSFVARA